MPAGMIHKYYIHMDNLHFKKEIVCIVMLILAPLSVSYMHADERDYLLELGVQGGIGYYVGDGTQHIFNNICEAYGAQFRYKIDERWALQLKGQGQRIAFSMPETGSIQRNQLINIDAVAEFNFFRFGKKQYNEQVKQITPYIFLGVGVAAYPGIKKEIKTDKFGDPVLDADGNPIILSTPNQTSAAAYLPFGIGLKWKFAKQWGLQVAWQQNLYFADNLENVVAYNNPNELNGTNILWNDFTSSFTIGIVFEFAKKQKICRTCDVY